MYILHHESYWFGGDVRKATSCFPFRVVFLVSLIQDPLQKHGPYGSFLLWRYSKSWISDWNWGWLMTPGNDHILRNVPTMKTGMTRLLLWVQIGISLSCTTVAQTSFDDMVSRKGWNILGYSFCSRNAMNIYQKRVKMAASDAWNHIHQPFLLSLLISAAGRWELGETISWSSKTSRMKLSLLWWKRERKETAWMDEGFPVLCNLQGGGTTWGFKQLL